MKRLIAFSTAAVLLAACGGNEASETAADSAAAVSAPMVTDSAAAGTGAAPLDSSMSGTPAPGMPADTTGGATTSTTGTPAPVPAPHTP